ncbi:hypothetical protein [Spirosoma sp. KNUC1025]|nr:hypothetical protein LN737_00105 [Spirosoma sp. KNUC1025]
MYRLSHTLLTLALVLFVLAISLTLIAACWLIATYLLKESALITLPSV